MDRHTIPPPAQLPAISIEFTHGLGDLVQLSIVLRHLVRHLGGVPVDVICDPAKVLSRTSFERDRYGFRDPLIPQGRYSQTLSLSFSECVDDAENCPSTKPYRCLREVFNLQPDASLFRYDLVVSEQARVRAAQYLRSISGAEPNGQGRYPVVLIHYQGFSSRMQKDLPHETVETLCREIKLRRRAVAILDTDRQSPVVDFKSVFGLIKGLSVWQNPSDPDPEVMTGLIAQSELLIAIDSGPLHLAGATDTPTIGVWTHHHPTRYFDLSPNVEHLVPASHRRVAPGPRALEYFERAYQHQVYGDLTRGLVEQLDRYLSSGSSAGEPTSAVIHGLTSTSYDERYYTEHLVAGLDYLGHGEWQRTYGRWLATALDWKGRHVLDVGCACGSIMRGLGEAGLIVQGFDLSEFMVQRGRRKWPDMMSLLHVCDAVNLHLWAAASWEGLHSNQVAEHWKPDLVPHILAELRRVLVPGGVFFCVLDTTELFHRQGRDPTEEDPTHVCIRPLAWWHDELAAAGWRVVTEEFRPNLTDAEGSFLKRYDWDFFIARNPDPKKE
jgi:SAM-dependent methyltransferase